jgi:Protein of unknown function (DUF3467)
LAPTLLCIKANHQDGGLMNGKKPASTVQRKMSGKYANYFEVGYNAFEFLMDFGQIYPELDTENAKFHTRIIINPTFAKNLLEVLQKSIEQYEENFKSIDEITEGNRMNESNFH